MMMKKVPFNITNPFLAESIITKGEYEKIGKKSEGGFYSDELVDVIHSLMHLVFFIYFINILLMYYNIFSESI
jgi:hypothetical protein